MQIIRSACKAVAFLNDKTDEQILVLLEKKYMEDRKTLLAKRPELNKELLSYLGLNILDERMKLERIRRNVIKKMDYSSLVKFKQSVAENFQFSVLNECIVQARVINEDRNEIHQQLANNSRRFEKRVIEHLKNKNVQMRLQYGNNQLYREVLRGKLRGNQFKLLRHYEYKSQLFTTPSTFWSGIVGNENKLWREELVVKKRESLRMEGKDSLKMVAGSVIYINPTLKVYESVKGETGKVEMIREGKRSYVRFRVTSTLKEIIKELPCTVGKLLSRVDVSDEILQKLVEYDVIGIDTGLDYGYYNLCEFRRGDPFSYKYRYACVLSPENHRFPCISKNKLLDAIKLVDDLSNYLCSVNNGAFERKLMEYVKKNRGSLSLAELLYSSIFGGVNPAPVVKKDYRCWSSVIANEKNYKEFVKKIKCAIDCSKIKSAVTIDWKCLGGDDSSFTCRGSYIYQYDNVSQTIIPEMLATQTGRLTMRYWKYIGEPLFLKNRTRNENLLQVNITSGTDLDNIAFDVPYTQNVISLNDTGTRFEEGKKYFGIEDVNLVIVDGSLKLSLADSKHLYSLDDLILTTTSTPGSNKLYRILNGLLNSRQKYLRNGHFPTRLELNRDYQPRVVMNGLLISRERFRIDKSDLWFTNKMKSLDEVLYVLLVHHVPSVFCVYSDTRYKPEIMMLSNRYDYLLLVDVVKSARKFVFFEEVFPTLKKNEFVQEYMGDIY